uniref:Uncharacterized protein n=1 Tax=Salix viminalis TaxID=40686 RepID=A0A6N2KB47_SALVM
MRSIVCHQSFVINPHIKRFKGRPEELKPDANFLTDASELSHVPHPHNNMDTTQRKNSRSLTAKTTRCS